MVFSVVIKVFYSIAVSSLSTTLYASADHSRVASLRLRKPRLVLLAYVGLRFKKRLLTVFCSLTLVSRRFLL